MFQTPGVVRLLLQVGQSLLLKLNHHPCSRALRDELLVPGVVGGRFKACRVLAWVPRVQGFGGKQLRFKV